MRNNEKAKQTILIAELISRASNKQEMIINLELACRKITSIEKDTEKLMKAYNESVELIEELHEEMNKI